MRDRERIEERREQRPPVGEVQRDEQPLGERLAGVQDRRQDAGLRLGRERARRLRPHVAGLGEDTERRGGQLGRRLLEEGLGRGQALVGSEVLPDAGGRGVQRHGDHQITGRAPRPRGRRRLLGFVR